jgi:hypothetical protein
MDRVFNYESESSGFGPHYLSKELQGYNGQVFWYRLKGDADRAAIEDRIFIFDGTPYDYGCLFKMAASHPEINTREMICSESSEVCVTGNISGVVHSPGELPGLGYWEPGIQIL